jgi:DNA-binding response OmpR family regulator
VKRKILLVDDDRVTLTMLEMILSRHKYQVLSAKDGSEGLELALKERPDAVISDMLIPKLHGLDLCKKIKQDPALNQIKVILMTAVYKGVPFKFEAKGCGADHFIEKPIDTNELIAVLHELLGNPSDNRASSED